MANKRMGAGVYIVDPEGTEIAGMEEPAGALCSSYGGECVAMLKACEWIRDKEDQEGEPQRILVATDSESLVNSIKNRDWKNKDEWLSKIKQVLAKIKSMVTILWIPSHCGIDGNEAADFKANQGRLKDQSRVPVTQAIVKAKIKAQKWQPTHEGARRVYGDRLRPRYTVECKWTRRMRTLFARLRTNHAKELGAYQHRIGNSESPNCKECNVPETILMAARHCN